MKNRVIAKTAAAGMLALSLCVGMAGCGGSAAPETQQEKITDTASEDADEAKESSSKKNTSKKTSEEPEKVSDTSGKKDSLKAVGSKKSAAFSVALTNGLGADVTSVQIKASDASEYDSNLLGTDEKIANGEAVRLYVPKSDDAPSSYDVKVTLVDEDEEVREVEFAAALASDYSTVSLLEADGVAYVEYATKNDEKGSTKEAALAQKAEQEVQEQEVYDEPKPDAYESDTYEPDAYEPETYEPDTYEVESEPETYYEPEPEPTYYEPEPTYSEPEPTYSEPEPTYQEVAAPVEAPVAPTQTGDACAGDVVLR
ncbi:MAG: hypothetical protein U0J70_12910 [Atopobiaceae bacterium]|nr:hypothetical protein [Atopobiaceae bacterium]